MFFIKKKVKREKAFGKIPAYCRYELFMERYRSASDFVRLEHMNRDDLRLLDVGSGSGHLKYFCDFGNIDWHGLEMSQKAISRCRDLGYKMYECDAQTEPFPLEDASFDVVVASHILEHLSDPEFALAQMSRVLKPGGLLILGVPVKPFLTNHLLTLYYRSKTIPKGGTRWAFDLFTFKRLLQRCLKNSFELVDVRGFRFLSARTRANWENHKAFYKANVWFGKLCPSLTREVNVVLRKTGIGLPDQK